MRTFQVVRTWEKRQWCPSDRCHRTQRTRRIIHIPVVATKRKKCAKEEWSSGKVEAISRSGRSLSRQPCCLRVLASQAKSTASKRNLWPKKVSEALDSRRKTLRSYRKVKYGQRYSGIITCILLSSKSSLGCRTLPRMPTGLFRSGKVPRRIRGTLKSESTAVVSVMVLPGKKRNLRTSPNSAWGERLALTINCSSNAILPNQMSSNGCSDTFKIRGNRGFARYSVRLRNLSYYFIFS